LAIEESNTSIIRILLHSKEEVDPNLVGPGGNTSLHYAVRSNKLDTVEWLIDRGADVNVRNNRNKSPLDLARQLHPNSRILGKLKNQLMKESNRHPIESGLRKAEYPASPHEKKACENTLIFVTEIYAAQGSDYYWTIAISVHELLYSTEPLATVLDQIRPDSVGEKSLACIWIHVPDNNVSCPGRFGQDCCEH
jgi:hypothetical protein